MKKFDLPNPSCRPGRTIIAGLLMLAGCFHQMDDKTIWLTKWIKARKVISAHAVQTFDARDKTQISYAIKRQKKWWLVSWTDWEDLDYDEVNVLDEQNVLAARTATLEKPRSGNKAGQNDIAVKLITAGKESAITICSGISALSAPPNASFIDCIDTGNDKKWLIKRMNFQGKPTQNFSIDVNQWEDLHPVKEVIFYDDKQQTYIVEMAKNRSYCRLLTAGKDKNQAYTLSVNGTLDSCADIEPWEARTQLKLVKPAGFGKLGMQPQVWKKFQQALDERNSKQ